MSDEFRERMVAFLPRLRRFAYGLSGDPAQADDLTQDACVRALASRDQWQPGTKFESWMFRITQNLWIDKRRSLKAKGIHADLDSVDEPWGDDGRAVTEGRLTLARVMKGMEALSPDQRTLMVLVCIDGASYKEAAEILSLPIGTVMSRLARARQMLQAQLVPIAVAEVGSKEKTRDRT